MRATCAEPRLPSGLQSGVWAAAVTFVALGSMFVGLVDAAVASNGIDLTTANRMIRDYSNHLVETLPPDWRRAQKKELRKNPPRIDDDGFYKVDSPAGRLVFDYDADRRRLICDAYVHDFDGKPHAVFGLSRGEIVAALEAAAARGVSTGGGAVFHDTDADGIFLRRVYESPVPPKQLAKELDRLTKAGDKWFYEHYLEAATVKAKSMAPPEGATASNGDFRATLVLTQDPSTMEAWNKAPGSKMPDPITRARVIRGRQMIAVVLFSGATIGDGGRSRVEGKFHADYPDGEPAAWNLPAIHWDREIAPPPGHLQHGERNVTLTFDDEQPLGTYLIRGRVCDVGSSRCVEVEHPFELVGPGS